MIRLLDGQQRRSNSTAKRLLGYDFVHPLLEINGLSVEFATAHGCVQAVRDVSFHIAAGEVLGLVGESGSGKSVTSLAILRLLPSHARVGGSVQFRGRDLLHI